VIFWILVGFLLGTIIYSASFDYDMYILQKIEMYLEYNECWRTLRQLRDLEVLFFVSLRSHAEQIAWRSKDRRYSRRLREIAQRETYLKEEIVAWKLKTQPSKTILDEPANFTAWRKELKNLNKEYLDCEEKHDKNYSERPSGVLMRRFHTYYREEMEFGRDECKEQGGCCGRQCRCCDQPRNTRRESYLSHCTIYCGCCIRHRGFLNIDLSDIEEG
jgi:hypothetical protein